MKKFSPQGTTYLSSVDAGRRFDMSNDHIARLCRSKKLVCEQTAGTWFVEESSLIAYRKKIKEQKKEKKGGVRRTEDLLGKQMELISGKLQAIEEKLSLLNTLTTAPLVSSGAIERRTPVSSVEKKRTAPYEKEVLPVRTVLQEEHPPARVPIVVSAQEGTRTRDTHTERSSVVPTPVSRPHIAHPIFHKPLPRPQLVSSQKEFIPKLSPYHPPSTARVGFISPYERRQRVQTGAASSLAPLQAGLLIGILMLGGGLVALNSVGNLAGALISSAGSSISSVREGIANVGIGALELAHASGKGLSFLSGQAGHVVQRGMSHGVTLASDIGAPFREAFHEAASLEFVSIREFFEKGESTVAEFEAISKFSFRSMLSSVSAGIEGLRNPIPSSLYEGIAAAGAYSPFFGRGEEPVLPPIKVGISSIKEAFIALFISKDSEMAIEHGEELPATTATSSSGDRGETGEALRLSQGEERIAQIAPAPSLAPRVSNEVPQVIERIVERGGVGQDELDRKLEQLANSLKSEIYRIGANAQSGIASNFGAIALTNKIDKLDDVDIGSSRLSNVSISGSESSFSGGSITGTSGTFSGSLSVGGSVTISGSNISTVSSNLSIDTDTFTVDATNNRVGIGTTSPYAKLSVVGEVVAANFTATTTATSSFGGPVLITKVPSVAHSFGTWSSGVSGSNPLTASFVVNPDSSISDGNLLALSVGGSAKFLVDAEGDVFANSITSVGGTTLSTTTASTFTVENNTTLGDATSTDRIYLNSRFASSLLPSTNNLLDLGDTSTAWRTGYFGTSIGIATTSPYAALSVVGETVSTYFTATSTNATSTFQGIILAQSGGAVGIGTSTPWRKLSLSNTVSDPQFTIAYDSTRYADIQVDSVGDLILNPQGDDVYLNDDNLYICAGGSCAAGVVAGTGNLVVETKGGFASSTPWGTLSVELDTTDLGFVVANSGSSTPAFVVGGVNKNGHVGIATSSPWSYLTIGANGAVTTVEKTLSDGATIAVDWRQGNQQAVTLGGNRTINFSGYVAGQSLRLILCQDATGSRTVTWGSTILWDSGTAPTLTTTANKCDITTFLASNATSSLTILGSSILNF